MDRIDLLGSNIEQGEVPTRLAWPLGVGKFRTAHFLPDATSTFGEAYGTAEGVSTSLRRVRFYQEASVHAGCLRSPA